MKATKLIAIISFALAAVSCSLEETPEQFVSRNQFYKTEQECQAAVNSCYRSIKSVYTNKFLAITEATSDLFSSNSTGKTDFTLSVSPSDPQFGTTIWSVCYQGIMYCNECVECIAKAEIDETEKGRMICEARIMRAMYYYILTNVFNGVPYYTCMVEDQKTLAEIRKLPRTDANEIRMNLYEDLSDNVISFFDAHPELQVRGSEVEEQRAGYAFALMLMAKFAMWAEEWDLALSPLERLEDLYGELTEANYPLEETMWRYKNTAESIFEIQHAWDVSGVQFHSTVAPSMYPTVQGDDWYDGVYMPGIATNLTKYNILTCTAHYAIYYAKKGTTATEDSNFANSIFSPLPLKFSEYDATLNRYRTVIDTEAVKTLTIRGKKVDRRAIIALGLGNLENGETFTAVQKYGKPFCGPKFWCPTMVTYHDNNNYKIFRYADAVLMTAECYARKGETEKALKYLNKTRARAGVDPVTGFLSEDDVMAEIRNERARELGGEMHRKFDLVRWGIWYGQTVLYNTVNKILQNNIQPCHRYYPIPDSECALSGYVLTNDEYNEVEY